MAGTVNKVILVGRLGKDPEIKYTPSGVPVAKFSLATDESYKDKSGEKKDHTEWHNIVAWSKLAEICGEYLTKGKLVYIEGTIRSNQWEDQSGNKRTKYEIIARQMTMLGSRAESERYAAARGERATPDRPAPAAPASASEAPPDPESTDDSHSRRGDASGHPPESPPEPEITDEDIPF
jgi:single-strand DNA-binding protein